MRTSLPFTTTRTSQPLLKLIEINDFLTECAAAVGLQYVPKKECVFQLPDSTRPASADLTSPCSSIADITKFVRSYFRCGGIAVGDPAAGDDYARRAACEYRTHVEHLARSQLQIQLKNVLFAWCGKPTTMLTYMIRAVAPSLTSRAAESTDDSVFAALSRAWKVAPDSFGRDDPHGWGRRKQAQLSVRRGCHQVVRTPRGPASLSSARLSESRSGLPRFHCRHAAHSATE
jgi:hypothetical protein